MGLPGMLSHPRGPLHNRLPGGKPAMPYQFTGKNLDHQSKIYIYSLSDPDSGQLRYIGKSIRPKGRYWNHCLEKSKCHRTNWIQSLVKAGKRPVLGILEILSPHEDWQEAERRWIAHGHHHGWPLTNTTEGGEGVPGLSGESKERLLRTWKGRKHKPESLAKMSAQRKGRRHSEEHKEHMHNIMVGREFTEEWKNKIANAVKKLAPEQVAEIKIRIKNGEMVKDLAEFYGVHRTTISSIVKGRYCPSAANFEELNPEVCPFGGQPNIFDFLGSDSSETDIDDTEI
jgi:DNA-binding XRE family transcriptional regulator